MMPFAGYRLAGLVTLLARVGASGVGVVSISAAAMAGVRGSTAGGRPPAREPDGPVPMGFLTVQPGAAVRLRSMQSTDAGLCGTAEIENLANVAITGVRFVSFAHAPSPLERTSLSTSSVGTSDLLAIDLPPGQIATLDVGLLTEAQAREMLGTPYAQLMCGIAEVRYANGGRWEMPPATVLGPERAEIPRALIGRAPTPGESFCRDDRGGEYSEGAVIAVRFEPLTFARCEAGAWNDHQLSALSAGKPFVWMDFVLADGHRPQLGVDPGTMARLEVGGRKWGIRPSLDSTDERRVRLEVDDLAVEPAARVADVWTSVGAPALDVPSAGFTVSVRSTRNP